MKEENKFLETFLLDLQTKVKETSIEIDKNIQEILYTTTNWTDEVKNKKNIGERNRTKAMNKQIKF